MATEVAARAMPAALLERIVGRERTACHCLLRN